MNKLKALLVDDEECLIDIVSLWLTACGFETTTCYTTEDAIKYIKENQYDFLFSDVILPGEVNGFNLAELALEQQKSIKVLLASGYTAGLQHSTELELEVLAKPYRKNTLLEKVSDLFELA